MMTYRKSLSLTLLLYLVTSCLSEPVKEPMKEEPLVAREFDRIEVITPKQIYALGETPDFNDWIVNEVFSDGYKEIITNYTVLWEGDILKPGTSVAAVTARNTTVEVDVVIGNKLVDTGLPVVYIETEGGQAITSKTTYINAKMTIEDGGELITESTMRIRGRGNATWSSYPKKPYKLKLDNETDLLGMGKDKDWILLANYCDKTLMRTSVALKLSELLGLPWTPKERFVELMLNGEYMGNYQLTESIKQDVNRVNIPKTGFIIERDGYYQQEPIWFKSSRGYGFSFKNPDVEDLTQAQVDYIKGCVDEFEGALYSTSFNDPVNGYAKYIDIDSFVRWFLFHQIIANLDTNPYLIKADMTSGSKLAMGPVWDFEWSLGIGWYEGSRPRPADYPVCYTEFYFNRLLLDANFAARLQQMWETYRSRVTRDILQHMDDVQKEIMESQRLNFKRWDIMNERISVGGIPMGSFEKEVECDRQFFINHMNWLGNWIPQQNPGN